MDNLSSIVRVRWIKNEVMRRICIVKTTLEKIIYESPLR